MGRLMKDPLDESSGKQEGRQPAHEDETGPQERAQRPQRQRTLYDFSKRVRRELDRLQDQDPTRPAH